MWPSGNGTIPINMQGTTLLADATDDHSLTHREIGTILNALPTTLGTTGGTNILKYVTSAGQFVPAMNTGGTLAGNLFGTFTLMAGTITGVLQNNGTIANGTLGTAFLQGGTISQAIYQLGTAGTLTLDNPILQHKGTNNGTIVGGTYDNPGIIINARARAYLGTAMGTVASNTEFKIKLDTIDYDTGTNMSLGTLNRFVAPLAGWYQINAQTSFPDGQGVSGGRWAVEIRKNGTNIQFGIAHASGVNGLTAQTAGIFQLAASDFIELWAYNLLGGNAGAAAGSIYNALSIHLLSV